MCIVDVNWSNSSPDELKRLSTDDDMGMTPAPPPLINVCKKRRGHVGLYITLSIIQYDTSIVDVLSNPVTYVSRDGSCNRYNLTTWPSLFN